MEAPILVAVAQGLAQCPYCHRYVSFEWHGVELTVATHGCTHYHQFSHHITKSKLFAHFVKG